jgi:hypothetical protein
MPAYSWPPLPFPQAILIGYTDTQASNVIMSEMDSGIKHMRATYTGLPRQISNAQLNLTKDQKVTLNDHYRATAGARFSWIDPDTGNACECRYLSPPSFNMITPWLFQATFAFEILP